VNLPELLNVANYSATAIEAVSSLALADLTATQAVVTASVALSNADEPAVLAALAHGVQAKPQGQTAFVLAAASMTAAAQATNQELFIEGLRVWITERTVSPQHFDHAVLTQLMVAGEDANLLSKIPTDLRKAANSAPKIKVPKVTASQQKVIDAFAPRLTMMVRQAVSANTDHLPIRVDVDSYRLDSVNARLREVTLVSSDESLPTLVVKLAKSGQFAGSFIAH
jgi:hypothetical protein